MHDIDKIYREHAGTVYKFLYTKTHNADWAEELTQETFYKAVNSLSSYDGSCKITTWLCQIGKHIWQQELTKKSKYQTYEISDDLAASTISIEDQLVQAEQKINIMRALHYMKDPVKEVLYLRLLGNLSYKEIGEILGQSETWARVIFYRGKQELLKGDERERVLR